MGTAGVIPSVNIVTTAVIVFISLFVPVVVSSVCLAGKFINNKAYFCGFGVFAIAELLFRAPLISAMKTDAAFCEFALTTTGLIVVGGASAGLIDETVKYICAGKILRKEISYNTALSFGLGTLCCEFIFVLGIQYVENLVKMIVIVNSSSAELMNLEDASLVIAQINSVTPTDMIFDLTSGISKAMFTLAAAVLVTKSAKQKTPLFWLLAIVLHTAFNSVLILISNKYIANGIAIFLGFMFMMYTILSKDEFEPQKASEPKGFAEHKKSEPRKQVQQKRTRNTAQSQKPQQKRKTVKKISNSSNKKKKKVMHNMFENVILSDESYNFTYNRKNSPEPTVTSQGQDIRSIYKRNMEQK